MLEGGDVVGGLSLDLTSLNMGSVERTNCTLCLTSRK